MSTSIVVVGFGRVGRRIGEIFEIRDVPYVAVDIDAGLVKRERRAVRSVFYRDARQPDVLKSLGVGEAGLIIVTVDDFQATEQVVASLRRAFPKLDILARGHDMDHCQSLREQGASLAVSVKAITPTPKGKSERGQTSCKFRFGQAVCGLQGSGKNGVLLGRP